MNHAISSLALGLVERAVGFFHKHFRAENLPIGRGRADTDRDRSKGPTERFDPHAKPLREEAGVEGSRRGKKENELLAAIPRDNVVRPGVLGEKTGDLLERVIAGEMPHYGFFFGPMHYRVAHHGARWSVKVTVAIEPPTGAVDLELPDCGLVLEVGGDEGRCSGTPYSASPKTDACPRSGSFAIDASPAHVRALLARWSREAARYYTRDARAFGLPIDYDFDFVLAPGGAPMGADLAVPLSPTCGRTPYFSAFRSGWSLPIVAHEVGHVLGLLDEYEAFSGLSSLYPKKPFAGAEVSRMGLSMREGTRVLPLHHYLIVRRFFCAEPKAGGFFGAQPL